MGDLTAANAVITLSQSTLFPVPQQLQAFAADDVTDMDPVEVLEHLMGVDGNLSFGFVWTERFQKITLQADSASNLIFDRINNQQQATESVFPLNGLVVLPGIGLKFILTNGGLKTYKPLPPVKKIVHPREFRIVWNAVTAAPV